MSKTAVIAGVGPGLGASLVRKFAREGCRVGMFARSADFLQTLAKEVDGIIDTPALRTRRSPDADEPLLDPDAMADAYWALIRQDRSAWTMELDLRPHREAFFE